MQRGMPDDSRHPRRGTQFAAQAEHRRPFYLVTQLRGAEPGVRGLDEMGGDKARD